MQPGSNRTDIISDPTKTPGSLPADSHGQQSARAALAGGAPTGPPRQSPGPLIRKTARPDEPVTAGLPIGPGPGPSGPAALTADQRALARLKVAAAKSASPALRRLLTRLES